MSDLKNSIKKTVVTLAASSAFILGLGSSSYAAPFTSSITVGATATPKCTLSADSLNFPDYSGTEVRGTSNIYVNCTGGISYTLGIDGGSSFDGNRGMRDVTQTNHQLRYVLYQDPNHESQWRDYGSYLYSGTGTGSQQTLIVYGVILPDSSYYPSTYVDTVHLTLTVN